MSAATSATSLSPALRLAWWGTAWLRGAVVTDLMLDAVIGHDATHTVAGLGELGLGGGDAAETLVGGLGRLRAEGTTSLGCAFPAEGDAVGLGGPPPFNHAALEAGEAVVADAGIGLVPVRVGAVITWQAYAAQRRQLPDVGEADRALRAALVASAQALADLDVARWRPDVADRLMNLRHRDPVQAAPGVPARCVELAERGWQAAEIVALALEDEGGAVTAYEMSGRREALLPLDRAARRALTAAGSPEAWPS
ncbi:hypothetical protein P5P86_12910 [Nocardioides sp. BP30]|uniref:hypothetical protein n=1 Tax=Nocardioides sp. BP30 TaxID=3036374 RepID=UPI0024687109|nr:hypothetical protein [Nocardioides sp. BP30]WGL50863.1 hypothetical protein P5P86_12910 [Nocardioides sp. BP30]